MRSLSKIWLAAFLSAATAIPAQQVVEVKDPANLTGEHIAPQSPADTLPINHGAAALQQLLLKLRTRASMMLIVAHPDDEDGGLLTYESRGQGRTRRHAHTHPRRGRTKPDVGRLQRCARPDPDAGAARRRPLHGRRPDVRHGGRLRFLEDERRSLRAVDA